MLFLDVLVFFVTTQNQYHVVYNNRELVTSFDTETQAKAYADVDPEFTVVYGELFSVLEDLA